MSSALPEPIRSMVEATRTGDDDAFVACFTADAHLEDWGRVFDGRSGVIRWNDSDNIGQGNQFSVTDAVQRGDTWVIRFDAHSRRRRGPGTLRITLTGDFISRFIIS